MCVRKSTGVLPGAADWDSLKYVMSVSTPDPSQVFSFTGKKACLHVDSTVDYISSYR